MAKSVKTLTLILVIIQKDKKINPVDILKFDINHSDWLFSLSYRVSLY